MAIDYSPPSPISEFPAETTETNQETQQREAVDKTRKDEFYKTKKIPFLGVRRLIILQHKNGPCPLIAICNFLLLRGDISLHPDCFEVSQETLLNLVVDTLMDVDVDSNDENQQKKISNAIEVLPRLVVGIDVNLKFRSVDDFEFTPELDIFGLLKIPLYHGWIPEDMETTSAIGGRSYDALTTGLVALDTQTQTVKARSDQSSGECSVDVSASITEALGVPSKRYSKTRSFADSPPSSAEHHRNGKGNIEEETALFNALKLSEREALRFDTHRDSSDVETENSSKITVVHLTTSEAPISVEKTNLESTENDIISEIPLKSEAVTSVNPALYESEESMRLGCPVYEGESLLSESSSEGKDTNELTPEEGDVIKNFLDDNVSQLTWTGIFALVEKLKERELCVLFRNNHFYTMLKMDEKLYTLVTDEGYLKEQNVVWERLKEINGNSVHMTGYFFEVSESNSGKSQKWDEQNAISQTADFIDSINRSPKKDMDIDSDLKLALELQELDWTGDIDSEVRMIGSKHMSSSIQEVKAVLRWQIVQSCI